MWRGVLLLLLGLLLGVTACRRDDAISPVLGAACREPADCSFRCLPNPAWPNGFCTRDCTRDTECPVESACVATTDGKVCLFTCVDDRQCDFLNPGGAASWRCHEYPDVNQLNVLVCAPGASPIDAGVP